jgi:hypothetical protein
MSRRRQSAGRRRPPRLDPKIRLVAQQFVALLIRCRCDPTALLGELSEYCRRLSRHKAHAAVSQDWGEMGHVMTLWFSDPEYLDVRGNPRPLPLNGRGLSIESLARRVDPKLDPRTVLPYLKSGGGVRRRGSRYVPRGQMLIFQGRPQNTRILRGLFGHIGTLYHNLHSPPGEPKWFERHCRNHRFPASAVEAFERGVTELFEQLLLRTDTKMAVRSQQRRKGERLVTLGFGGYKFVEGRSPRTLLPSRARKRRKRR